MSFSKYDAYKDSGVEWLGDLPSRWDCIALNAVVSCNDDVLPDSTPPHFEMQYVEISDVEYGRGIHGSTGFTYGTAPSRARRGVVDGDVLVSTVRTYLRAIARVASPPENMIVSTGFAVLRPTAVHSGFLGYLMTSEYVVGEIISHSVGVSYPAINAHDVMRIKIPQPPLEEQKLIAAFLDRETAKIDALVEEQRRLIELLKEKRQAVISHAVTKGLNPDAPMKDSGVEWLGEVPAHWKVARVGHRYEVQLGRMLNEERSQGDNMRPYLRVLDVQWDAINFQDLPEMDFPPDAQLRYRLRAGDLLVNEGGSYVGRSAIWHGELEECYYQKALHRLRPFDGRHDTADFFLFGMEMAAQLGVFVAGANQTTIDHLTAEQLRSYRFGFPPLVEQQAIATHIRSQLARLEPLMSEAETVISLLQERRSALISAAVTGKIDVRGLVPAEAEAA